MRYLLALACLAWPLTAQKIKVDSLKPIPKEAELIVASAQAGEKSETEKGWPSNELYVADAEGGHLTRITCHRKLYNHFAVSPDRKMVAASRYTGEDTNRNGTLDGMDKKVVYVIDLEHKEEWPLLPAQYQGGWGGIDWTPDGQYIITSVVVDRKFDIYRIHPDGSGLENVTKNLHKLLGLEKPVRFVSDVSVSFDGKWIVFLCKAADQAVNRVAMMRIDGSEARFVTDGGGLEAKSAGGMWPPGDYDPEFSPDGQNVCFQRVTGAALVGVHSSSDVMRIRIDGTDLRRLSAAGNKAVHGICDWSADNRLVFSEWDRIERRMGPILVNADGTNYHRIAKLANTSHVRWIPVAQ